MSETCIKFGEFGARVMIENKEVQHYAINVDPARKEVSCWIASQEGKAFSVVWLELGRDIDYPSGGVLYLDGHYARMVFRPNEMPITFRYIVSESSYVPFLFSPLAVTDDDTYLDTSPTHSIGEIKLVIVRTTIPEVAANSEERRIHRGPPTLQKVHERSKKAIAHRVNYGSEIPRPQMTSYYAEPVERIVTFIFRYRSLEMLRANDIVPRNPEPLETLPTSEMSTTKGEKSKVKREAESSGSDTDDDDSLLGIREKALLAELEKVRKERQVNSNRPRKRVKKEERPHFMPGEIIDLT